MSSTFSRRGFGREGALAMSSPFSRIPPIIRIARRPAIHRRNLF